MKKLFFFVFIPIILTTSGEFILKHSVNEIEAQAPVVAAESASDSTLGAVRQTLQGLVGSLVTFLSDFRVFSALMMIVIGGVLWLVAMSKYEMSFLYPFLSINYTAIIVGSQFFLGEQVSWWRYISVVLIVIGLVLISRSPYSESDEERYFDPDDDLHMTG